MKVVLFCGGYGMRMLGWSGEGLPKPLQLVDDLPLVVYVMNHYATYGHTDFVLRLGHVADQIQDTVNLVVANHPRARYWNVGYLDTGMDTPIGERLWLVRHFVAGEETFFTSYSDVLPDISLDDMVKGMRAPPDATAVMLAVRPNVSLHMFDVCEDETVAGLHCLTEFLTHENDSHPILRQPFFDLLGDERNLDIVFETLLAPRQLIVYRHDGFWLPADTFKECTLLDATYDSGNVPQGRRDMVTVP